MNPTPRDVIIALSVLHGGDWSAVYNAMRKRAFPPDEDVVDIVSSVRSKVITFLDDEYPLYLREGCIRPPLALFYYGDISLLRDPERILTVVGAREPTEYGARKTRELCREMVEKNYILASGLAYGIDTIAAEESAPKPGHAIAVLGCGIDRMYPLENTPLRDRIASTGLLLSEYSGATPPDSKNFPLRNRILAGIGKAVFASEVHHHSGTSITVAFAMEMDRDVGVLPFRADEDFANNDFLKHGAALINEVEDLVLMMEGKPRFRGNFYK